MNISSPHIHHKCTSCQMCAAVCPKDAIQVSLDEEGFYRPYVDDKICVDCGLCVKVCYKYDAGLGLYSQEQLDSTVLYSAYAKDPDILKDTTSGGVADILARELFNRGYHCVGVVYDSINDRAVNIVATSEEDLDGFRGSKYIQSFSYDAFKALIESGLSDKFAVFGTPCQIYALDKYLKIKNRRDNCILIDLYCHGCPSLFLWKKYIIEIKKKLGIERVNSVNFRSKTKGWGRFNISVKTGDGHYYHSSARHNEFFDLFFCDQLLNPACTDCVLRSSLGFSDIRLGDFWGRRFVLNHTGVSAVSVVSQRAASMFEIIRDKIEIQSESYSDFLSWQSWGKTYEIKPDLRRVLLQQITDPNMPLKTSVSYLVNNQSVKNIVIGSIKRIVLLLPQCVESYIRLLFYSIKPNG